MERGKGRAGIRELKVPADLLPTKFNLNNLGVSKVFLFNLDSSAQTATETCLQLFPFARYASVCCSSSLLLPLCQISMCRRRYQSDEHRTSKMDRAVRVDPFNAQRQIEVV